MKQEFKDYKLKLLNPSFDSKLIDLIIDLDILRNKQLYGSTPSFIFFQIKHIFYTLESIGSARIEGNHTTISEYIENIIDNNEVKQQNILEIQNMEEALNFIDCNYNDINLNRIFISELHKLVVKDLLPPPKGEGDNTPGFYRKTNVEIHSANHIPPDYILVNDYMNELFEFIQNKDNPKYDLIKIALAHHRFVWMHPFTNGNGRTVRLFTYAMLINFGFSTNIAERIINPTAIFCCDRNKYYDYLTRADEGINEGLLEWCEYVLSGLKVEIEKVDKLTDYNYLKTQILLPALHYSLERQYITDTEFKVLKKSIDKGLIQAEDIKEFFPNKTPDIISRKIKSMIEKKLLLPEKEKGRKYYIRLNSNYLLRGVIHILGKKGFLAIEV